jgi:hypothetical protein
MALRHLPGPLFSCCPVITEAAWLLRGHPRALKQLLGSLEGGFLELVSLSGSEGTAIAEGIRGMRTFALNSRTPRWFTWLNARASTPSLRWISVIFRFTARGAGVPSAFCLNYSSRDSHKNCRASLGWTGGTPVPTWFVVIRDMLLLCRRQAPYFCAQ